MYLQWYLQTQKLRETQLWLYKVGICYQLWIEYMGLVKNTNHFTVWNKFSNLFTNRKQLDTHIVFFDEITNLVERAYIRSLFMGYCDAENGVESNERPKSQLKLLDVSADNRKYSNPSALELLFLGSWGIGGFKVCTVLNKSALTGSQTNFLRITSTLSKKLVDYLQPNDLHELHQGRSTRHFFLLKSCEHLWLENSKSVTEIIEIWENMKNIKK